MSFLLLIATALFARDTEATFDRDLAVRVLEHARSSIDAGDEETARFLLQRAHGIDPEYGDALYYLAALEPARRDTVHYRERLLRRAIQLGLSSETLTEEAICDLSRILIDSGRSGEAVTLLDNHARRLYGTGSVDAALTAVAGTDEAPAVGISPARRDRLFLEALLHHDQGWFSSSFLFRMRSRYPEDPEIAYLDWRRHETISPAYTEWLSSILRTGPGGTNRDRTLPVLPAVRAYLQLLRDDDRRIRSGLTEVYYEHGGTDPLPLVMLLLSDGDQPTLSRTAAYQREYLESALLHGDKRVWEMITGLVGHERFEELLPEPFSTAYDTLKNATDREMTRTDAHGGGFESYLLDSGALRRWRRDHQGNGVFDVIIEFDRDLVRMYKRYRDTVIRLDYAPYPMVVHASSYSVDFVGAADTDAPADTGSDTAAAWTIDGRREVVGPGSRRWTPPQPVPFDVGLGIRDAGGDGRWIPFDANAPLSFRQVLSGVPDYRDTPAQRFARQFTSADAREISSVEETEQMRYLRDLGMLR